MTDIAFTGNFFRNATGITFADTAGTSWAFDASTNTLTLSATVAGTVADDAITNAKLANMAQSTIKGRASGAGTGDPADLTASQVKTILAIVSGDISDFTEAAQDAIGALMTSSATIAPSYNDAGNALSFSVIDGTITYAKMQNVSAANRVLGRITAGAGTVEELTGANLATIIGTSLGANPSAKVGPTATNGSAGTYMRSDAAPAIDLTASYAWTNVHSISPAAAATALSITPASGQRAIQVTASSQFGIAITIGNTNVGLYLDNTTRGAGTAALRIDASATTGAKTATFSASNKPGTTNATTPATWIPFDLNGTLFYVPAFAA